MISMKHSFSDVADENVKEQLGKKERKKDRKSKHQATWRQNQQPGTE